MHKGASAEILKALEDLRVPKEFARYEDHSEAEIIVRLEQWKQNACNVLSALRETIRSNARDTRGEEHELVYCVSSFDGEGPWVLDTSRTIARDILASFENAEIGLLERILRDLVKPIFAVNPHPSINAETGRKLARPAGGPMGHLDYLEGQEWKSHPELFNVISWCLSHTDSRSVERLWHLFIPPTMTYLDDYQAAYKLQGVGLASQLLEVAPPELLRRTGIDILLTTSLKTCLTFLHNSQTPDLIRSAARVYIRLVKYTTTPGSAAQFDLLCSLLGESIIGSVWVYASRDLDAIQASVDVIPDVVEALDIGASRYLKALIPQLVFPLIPGPGNDYSAAYKMTAVRALCSVITTCRPRIHKWRGAILEGILKCWVNLAETGPNTEGDPALQAELRTACAVLAEACRPAAPEIDAEMRELLSLDPTLFGPMLQPLLVNDACSQAHY
ncbi:hypothetical protein OH77DRAFT_755501 [Trametes cingulata]|nr:hypothetical protein OH77DRAFT_755501 [Trametes cingulata]